MTAYLIHDALDRKEDKRKNTPKIIQKIPTLKYLLLLLLSLSISLLPWRYLPYNIHSLQLLGAEILLIIAYGMPPLRLKNYPYIAVLCDALYAYAIPCLLASYTFMLLTQNTQKLFLILLSLWTAMIGIRHYLNHLCMEYQVDAKSPQNTLAQLWGTQTIQQTITQRILPSEYLLFLATILSLTTPLHIKLLLLLFFTYTLIHGIPIMLPKKAPAHTHYSFQSIPIDQAYAKQWPVWLLICGAMKDPLFLALIPIHLLIFGQIPYNFYLKSCHIARIIANYAAYYLKKYALQQTEYVALGKHYESHMKKRRLKQMSKKKNAIAIVNVHKKKFSETFIWESLDKFSFGVYYLWGTKGSKQLPEYWGDNDTLYHPIAKKKSRWNPCASPEDAEKNLRDFLSRKNIQTLLIHFGPTAIRLLPSAQALGIPIIVYFHGYDVHHKTQWTAHHQNYRTLYRYASTILCASASIAARLQKEGAPKEKTHVLPAYVNFQALTFNNHRPSAAKLLFVGRFCEVKAPHLLLLAFAKMKKNDKKASLTLIGDGPLWESSQMLAKALKIDTDITFLGALPHHKVIQHMQTHRALILPSCQTPTNHDKEGTPIVIIEAAASGLPIIATKHEGIAELITHNKEGILVKEYDLLALSKAMKKICHNDALAKKLAENAWKKIRKHPKITKHIPLINQIIQNAKKQFNPR